MKFIHLADVHLSAVPENGTELGKMRGKEIYQTFYRILDTCEEEQTDLLLIAGDLFHRPPLVRELKEINYYFAKLTHTRVVMIAGNHDYIGIHSNYRSFSWAENVTMLPEDRLQSVYFEDINTRVYGFSYHSRDCNEALPETTVPESDTELSILMLHGGEPTKLPFNKAKLAAAGFDYVALGHIHTPGRLYERMAYTGSLEPLDKNETGQHGYFQGKIGEHGGALELEYIPAAQRSYCKLEVLVTPDMTNGAVSDYCEQQIRELGENNMYRIVLKGRRFPEMVLDREMFYSLGIVIEVEDETIPDFDFAELEKENRDNILGMFIRRIRSVEVSEEMKEKALNYGMEALMKAGLH